MKIYKQKVFVHHYTEYMEQSHFDYCLNNCEDVISKYQETEDKHIQSYMGGSTSFEDDDRIDPYRFKPIV